jgi:tetratricopeptide (TPR) repeat protein
MKVSVPVLMSVVWFSGMAAGQQSEFATGRAYYAEGQFKKAAAHFELALRSNPGDADSYYWGGLSYEVLADIAAPFDHKYNSKARVYLTKATQLASGRLDYRRELFTFLLDSNARSRATLRQAASLLRSIPESDPEYTGMRYAFEQESRANSSAEAVLGRVFFAAPRAFYRVGELPASGLSSRAGPARSGSPSPTAR